MERPEIYLPIWKFMLVFIDLKTRRTPPRDATQRPAEENQGWPGGLLASLVNRPPGHPWFSSAGFGNIFGWPPWKLIWVRTPLSKLIQVDKTSHTPHKTYKGRLHLLYIFHGGRPGGRPPWKMYRRWLFPYKFCVGYSVATKLMRVRSFDEFWRSSWKLMRVIRRTILLYINIEKVSNCFVIIETKLNTVMIMIDSTY